jgi:RNA polymerase sigma factor (sigma-70 family)
MKANPTLDLVQAACEGDTDAVETLLHQYQPSITRFAHRYCAAEDVEDAVQETLWAVYRKIGYLRTAQAFISWTFQIVRHHCYRMLAMHRQLAVVDLDPLTQAELLGEDDPLYQELKQDVVKALQALPLAYRQVLILRDLEGYTAPETSERLGITLEAVKSRLHRGRAIMRENLVHWGTQH